MTVFLTLIMTVLLSLCLTLIEGARTNALRMESYLVDNIAVDSIMAEYHRELAKQYNLFAIEDSYGGENASLENTENHLATYLSKNFSNEDFMFSEYLYRDFLDQSVSKAEIEGVLYFSDDKGRVFRRRSYEAIKDDIGVNMLTEIIDCVGYIEENGLETIDAKGQMEKLQDKADGAQKAAKEAKDKEIAEAEKKRLEKEKNESDKKEDEKLKSGNTPNDETEDGNKVDQADKAQIVEVRNTDIDTNPTKKGLSFADSMVLGQFVDTDKISSSKVDTSKLISGRKKQNMINAGNLELEKDAELGDVIERMVFQEYLIKYMGRFTKSAENDALKYQLEYLIAGNDSDADNLVSVLGRILAIRYAIDFHYILSDKEKCAEAEALAAVISYFTFTEGLVEVYKTLFLLMWAGLEAQYDVKCMLQGERISFIKSAENWHTGIGMAPTLPGGKLEGDKIGLSYEDYLRIFMLMTNVETLTFRAMDMVEADMRLTPGNDNFRMDACIDTLAVDIVTSSSFGQSFENRIKRRYE